STSLPSKSSKRMTQMTWLYALEASHDYDPGLNLEKIWAPLLAINFAEIKRVPHRRAIVIPSSDKTGGLTAAIPSPLCGRISY
ncbi:MAG TPA: hypothetical protein VH229_02330, partial [Candidatus Udaeobacter sp.]|nr:hypothetical protein [Candidatus Udaeobacter sp.]